MPPKFPPKLPTEPEEHAERDDNLDEKTRAEDKKCYSCIGITYYNAEMARRGLPPVCTGIEQTYGPKNGTILAAQLTKNCSNPSRINDQGETKIYVSSYWTGYMTRTGRGPVVDGPLSISTWESEKSAAHKGNMNVLRVGLYYQFWATFYMGHGRFDKPESEDTMKLVDVSWGRDSSSWLSIPTLQVDNVQLQSTAEVDKNEDKSKDQGKEEAKEQDSRVDLKASNKRSAAGGAGTESVRGEDKDKDKDRFYITRLYLSLWKIALANEAERDKVRASKGLEPLDTFGRINETMKVLGRGLKSACNVAASSFKFFHEKGPSLVDKLAEQAPTMPQRIETGFGRVWSQLERLKEKYEKGKRRGGGAD